MFVVLGVGCTPEYEESEIEGGWISYAVGLCETKEGREPERTCSEAKQCNYFCCECENGTQYSVAACFSEEGCADFGTACREAESKACE